jgi:L-lysine 6-transaminase
MWAHQNFGVEPDILCFGKKTQVCGIMASDRINEVDSVFKVSSRINSTWGGNIVDMVRAQRIFEVIEEENLVENAAKMGEIFQKHIKGFCKKYYGFVSNARGLGLFCAFDLPDTDCRDAFITKTMGKGLITLKCGPRTIRFRPPLNVSEEEIEKAAAILDESLGESAGAACDGDTSGAVHTE